MPEYFFEGAEKLLEIWFTSDQEDVLKKGDLRNIGRADWEEILKLVNCQILSVRSNDGLTAYVLSESSMFVSRHRFILKTCGTTTLLHAIKPIIKLVREKCGLDTIEDMFYSRKNFEKPEKQIAPHTSFDQEVGWLDDVFTEGSAYSFGKVNGDCWHLYTMNSDRSHGVQLPDQTFELLMTDLDPEVMKYFYMENCVDGKMATKMSGIDTILPKSIIDDFLFEPCGYSANGLLPNGQYWTIHITPEPEFAYVSFETNVPQQNYQLLMKKVLEVFRPGKASLTIFANKVSVACDAHRDAMENWAQVADWKRCDHHMAIVKNYNLTYSFYKNIYS